LSDDRDDAQDDVRTTSEELIADSRELAEIERRKLEPSATPNEIDRLSAEAAELTRDMARKAAIQLQLATDEDAPD
jgi:hypothetical protein